MMEAPHAGAAVGEELAGVVRRSRWFPAKSAGHSVLRFDDVVPLETGRPHVPAWLTIVSTDDDPSLRLVVPLMATPDGTHSDGPADAATAPHVIAPLLRLVHTEGRADGMRGHLEGRIEGPHSADDHALAGSSREMVVRPLGTDASNTSLLVETGGRRFAVKIVRRYQSGMHPQVEIGRFFSRHSPFRGTPPLVGWVEHRGDDGESATVMIVEAFLEGRETGWDRLLFLVGRDWSGCLEDARSLGRLTASMHAALAARDDLASFAPQEWPIASAAEDAEDLLGHARHALGRIGRFAANSGHPLAHRLDRLATAGTAVTAALTAFADKAPSCRKIRVHGDYHLGQVLVPKDSPRPADDDWSVIDFEGEPARPLANRRDRHPAVKDVAGMCRSFDYLLRVAAWDGLRPYRRVDRVALAEAFLQAYRAAARGRSWWPSDDHEERRLLDTWTLDKAIYELAYECDNRPDWIGVPLAAVEEMVFGSAAVAADGDERSAPRR